MGKSNLYTLLSFIVLMATTVGYMSFGKESAVDSNADSKSYITNEITNESTDEITSYVFVEDKTEAEVNEETVSEVISETVTTVISETVKEVNKETVPAETVKVKERVEKEKVTKESHKKKTKTRNKSLFIGDSRMLGISEYANIKKADFFVKTGMSIYNIHDQRLSVEDVGKVSLIELLDKEQYSKVYIMLGVNEIGYNIDATVKKYKKLVEYIQEKQKESIVIIQANLHVTKSKSQNDKVLNNNAIDKLNKKLSNLADNKTIYYLDANVLFDDGGNNLGEDKSADGIHLYAKYYTQWGKWIVKETSLINKNK